MLTTPPTHVKVCLITGSARRIGAVISEILHTAGFNVVIHYHHNKQAATHLVNKYNEVRPDSACALGADLQEVSALSLLAKRAYEKWGRLDGLINNASVFFPDFLNFNEMDVPLSLWNDLMNINLRAPFLLAQACYRYLKANSGAIINITDTHALVPLKNYSIYSISKAGLAMATKTLAKEWAPDIRVNSIAPGAIMWPEHENELSEAIKQEIIEKTALKCHGDPRQVAYLACFLLEHPYITGQTIHVDGGRHLGSLSLTL